MCHRFEPNFVIIRLTLGNCTFNEILYKKLFSPLKLDLKKAQSAEFISNFYGKNFVIIKYGEKPRKDMTKDGIKITYLDAQGLDGKRIHKN